MTERGDQTPSWMAPVDFPSMVAHVAHVPDQLVAAWSRGLDAAEVQNGLTALDSRMQSLFTAYRGLHSGSEQTLSEMPMSDASLNKLSRGELPDALRATDAEMVALHEATDALRWVRQPSRFVTHLPEGNEESLWDAGVFSICRDRLSLLVRLREHTDGVINHRPVFPRWMRLMACARRAAAAGLPEATLLYLRLVLVDIESAFSEAVGTAEEQGQPAVDAGDVLSAMPLLRQEFSEVRDAFTKLFHIVEGWASGDVGDLPTVVLLADGLLRRIGLAISTRLFAFDPDAADGAESSSD